MKIRSGEASSSLRTDRQTVMTKLITAFRDIVDAYQMTCCKRIIIQRVTFAVCLLYASYLYYGAQNISGGVGELSDKVLIRALGHPYSVLVGTL